MQAYNTPSTIYGIHDPGGEHIMEECGVRGWIVFTHALGSDPKDMSGFDYRPWADKGHGILARLNYGYEPMGTIPYFHLCLDFARRCANFVAASRGCSRWIIGNEMNYAVERPGGQLHGQHITPFLYGMCLAQCYRAIHSVSGHEEDEVIMGAVAPWNNQTSYPDNYRGDWVHYFVDTLWQGGRLYDGIALHTYTHTPEPWRVYTDTWMNAPFEDRHYDFLAYYDFMEAIPKEMHHLPVYITETDQDVAWLDENTSWVQRAYGEIDHWNKHPDHQQILALCLYRWQRGHDRWGIEGKQGVIADYRDAVQQGYTWEG